MKSLSRRNALVIATLAFLTCGAANAQNALDNVLSSKMIRVGIPTDYPPYGFVGPDMAPQGLDVDMARYIAAKLGVRLELIPVVAANRIPYLQTKKADLIISTLGKNPEREAVIDFSSAYAPFFMAVYGAKSVPIKSFADLSGKTIAVTRGEIAEQELNKVGPANLEFRRFEDNNATYAAIVAGQMQLLATSSAVAGNLMLKNPGAGIEYKLAIKESPCFIGVSKGEAALKARVNEIVAAAKSDGTLNALSKKYLGRDAGELPL